MDAVHESSSGSYGVGFAATVVVAALCDPRKDASFVLMAPEAPHPTAFRSTAAMDAEAIFSEEEQVLEPSFATRSTSFVEGTGGNGIELRVHAGALCSNFAAGEAVGGNGGDYSTGAEP